MPKTVKEEVFLGTDTTFSIKLYNEHGTALDLSPVTRMKLWLGSACTYLIDSDDYPDSFEWVTPTLEETGVTEFKLGSSAEDLSIPANTYKTRWKLYTALQPNGVVVADPSSKTARLTVKILASCEAV